MKKRIGYIASSFLLSVFSTSITQAGDEDLPVESKQAVADFKKADSTLQTFFTNSVGQAVFPSVGKGGFIVGGAHGKGVVYEKGKIIGRTSLSQASIGAQVGGQAFAEIIFFETAAALEDFKAGKFEMSADVSAVAAAEGVSKTAKYKLGIAVFTLPKKGLMVQASIGGQKFKFEPESSTGKSSDKKE